MQDLYSFPGARTDDAKEAFSRLVPNLGCLYLPSEPLDSLPDRIGLYGAFGRYGIETYADGSFQFSEAGPPALIIGAHGPGQDDPFDLVAWRPVNPRRIWTLNGIAPILGEYYASKTIYYKAPLKVMETPESWLASGLVGCVMLDWRRAALQLTGAAHIMAETKTLAQGLAQAFTQTTPQIRIIR